MGKPITGTHGIQATTRTHVRIAFRPRPFLLYEHMFSSTNPTPLKRRALDTLCLVRSFLLLEDDYDVDWEVGQDERIGQSPAERERGWLVQTDRVDHPHRKLLQSRLGSRRAGMLAPREQVCLCPVPARVSRARTRAVVDGGPRLARTV